MVDFPTISYLATSSKKVTMTSKKVPKLKIQNVIFFIHRIDEIGQNFSKISKFYYALFLRYTTKAKKAGYNVL